MSCSAVYWVHGTGKPRHQFDLFHNSHCVLSNFFLVAMLIVRNAVTEQFLLPALWQDKWIHGHSPILENWQGLPYWVDPYLSWFLHTFLPSSLPRLNLLYSERRRILSQLSLPMVSGKLMYWRGLKLHWKSLLPQICKIAFFSAGRKPAGALALGSCKYMRQSRLMTLRLVIYLFQKQLASRWMIEWQADGNKLG